METSWLNRLRSLWRTHVRSRWYDHEWPVVWALALIALGLGYVGFSKHFAALGETRSPADLFYLSVQLFVLESGAVSAPVSWELEVARLLAPGVAVYTAVQALAVIFREQLQLLRVRFLADHAVVCGLGRKGLLLVKAFHERGYRVVVIDQDEDNNERELCRELGALVLSGNVTDEALLRKARVDRAKYLISVCGNDGTNAEVAVRAHALVGDSKSKALTCLAHIADTALWNLLREQELETWQGDSFRLEFFNIYESGARTLLNEHPAFSETDTAANDQVHILIVGLGRMGESLVVSALRKWRALYPKNEKRLRITVVDKEAEPKTGALRLRYPHLFATCDLILQQMDIYSPEFQRAEFLFADQERVGVTMVYVCFDDDSRGLSAALALLRRTREAGVTIPVVVRMTQNAGLATLLHEARSSNGGLEHLAVFGLLDRTCTLDLILGGTHEVLARAIHEDYVRKQQQEGQTPQTNPSMVPWEQLPENLKESNRLQADHIGVKLKAIRCGIAPLMDWDVRAPDIFQENIELLAEMEHDRWMDERLRDGWQLGELRDVSQKVSPYLVPWNNLQENIKDYDRNTVGGLPVFLAKVGFRIVAVGTSP